MHLVRNQKCKIYGTIPLSINDNDRIGKDRKGSERIGNDRIVDPFHRWVKGSDWIVDPLLTKGSGSDRRSQKKGSVISLLMADLRQEKTDLSRK